VTITILPGDAGEGGCEAFFPDSATATVGQYVQWQNQTNNDISLESGGAVFTTIPAGGYSTPLPLGITLLDGNPGLLDYGPSSCGPAASYAVIGFYAQ
jgi:hypothetical protein